MRVSAAIAAVAYTASIATAQCVSSVGASIQIISPAQGQTLNVGETFRITWNLVNTTPQFNAVNLTFVLSDATNPNNVLPLQNGALVPKTPAIVSDAQAEVTVPNVPSSKFYAVQAQYKDLGAVQKWMGCFSPTFAIGGGSAPVATGAAVTTTKTSGVVGGPVLKVLVGLATAFLLL
ncbi:hypothetical protein BDR26DRAFT_858726 [Obelidium mucronatum]|nr:hypothetical protein BDR26DRAFT_858726 [Obelidium mucronatum]